jgi:bifunctional DNase/RNase
MVELKHIDLEFRLGELDKEITQAKKALDAEREKKKIPIYISSLEESSKEIIKRNEAYNLRKNCTPELINEITERHKQDLESISISQETVKKLPSVYKTVYNQALERAEKDGKIIDSLSMLEKNYVVPIFRLLNKEYTVFVFPILESNDGNLEKPLEDFYLLPDSLSISLTGKTQKGISDKTDEQKRFNGFRFVSLRTNEEIDRVTSRELDKVNKGLSEVNLTAKIYSITGPQINEFYDLINKNYIPKEERKEIGLSDETINLKVYAKNNNLNYHTILHNVKIHAEDFGDSLIQNKTKVRTYYLVKTAKLENFERVLAKNSKKK